jgi:hypothetical protein
MCWMERTLVVSRAMYLCSGPFCMHVRTGVGTLFLLQTVPSVSPTIPTLYLEQACLVWCTENFDLRHGRPLFDRFSCGRRTARGFVTGNGSGFASGCALGGPPSPAHGHRGKPDGTQVRHGLGRVWCDALALRWFEIGWGGGHVQVWR